MSDGTSAAVRDRLIDALRLDRIGPDPRNEADEPWFEEELPQAPSKWHLTGFLIPFKAEHRADDDVDAGELDEVRDEGGGADDNEPEATSHRKSHFPASMGLSVLVTPDTRQLHATMLWGDIRAGRAGAGRGGAPQRVAPRPAPGRAAGHAAARRQAGLHPARGRRRRAHAGRELPHRPSVRPTTTPAPPATPRAQGLREEHSM